MMNKDLILGILWILIGSICLIANKKDYYPRMENHGLNFKGFVSGIMGIILGVILIKNWIISLLK